MGGSKGSLTESSKENSRMTMKKRREIRAMKPGPSDKMIKNASDKMIKNDELA